MKKALFFAIVSLMIVGNAAGQAVVGTYRLVSFTSILDDGTSYDFFGAQPVGYAIITPTRFMAVLAAPDRKPGNSSEARLALFNSMIAYSGPYSIEGSKLITDVQVSWNQAWTGTKQGRTWTIEDDKLVLVTDRAPSIKDPSKMVSGRLVWQRIE